MDSAEIKAVIDSPLLSLLGRFVPQAGLVINFVRAHEGVIVAAVPVAQAAVEEGASVFEAAKAKAPKFADAVTNLIRLLPSANVVSNSEVHVENISRNLAGIPRLTPDEEMAWLDRAAPGNDPSQENSKFTVG